MYCRIAAGRRGSYCGTRDIFVVLLKVCGLFCRAGRRMTPYKGLFLLSRGVLHGRGRDAPSDVAPRRQVFVSKTAFSAVAPYFFEA